MADETLVNAIADLIAKAEGYFVSGSRPNRNNNPGDLTVDIAGGGKGIGFDGPFVVYGRPEDGWADLRQQVRLMLDNLSHVYNTSMTILEVAQKYASTSSAADQLAWAQTVASGLGVTVQTKLSQLSAPVAEVVAGGTGVLVLVLALFWLLRKGR